MIARGEILRNSTQTTENGVAATEHSYSFLVTDSMMPNVHVLASYVRQDGEIVADFLEITVAVQLQNQVSIVGARFKYTVKEKGIAPPKECFLLSHDVSVDCSQRWEEF